MLAPSSGERATAGIDKYIDDASAGSFVSRALAWRNRVASCQDNVGLFYFGGHGIQRSKEDSVLLLQDFGKPGPLLGNAVAFFDIFSGMAPSDTFPTMAATQFYFIDACRNLPDEVKNFATLKTRPIFDDNLGGEDNRAAPVFFGAYNGSFAFASQFTNAVLDALGRGADSWCLMNGQMRWPVTTLSLITGIANAFAELTTTQDFMPVGHVKDRTLCYLDSAPMVDLRISVSPEQQRKFASLSMRQTGGGNFVWTLAAPPTVPHPYNVKVPWGTHVLSVNLTNGQNLPAVSFGPLPINHRLREWPVELQ
jgi:hypothetical protein